MATASTTDKYSDTPRYASSKEGKNDEKSGRKLTVLESHGYAVGKTIGAGSYATVKVRYASRFLILRESIFDVGRLLIKKKKKL